MRKARFGVVGTPILLLTVALALLVGCNREREDDVAFAPGEERADAAEEPAADDVETAEPGEPTPPGRPPERQQPEAGAGRETQQIGSALRVEADLPREIAVGSPATMRVTVENTSDQPVREVAVSQKLPESFELASAKVGDEELDPASRAEGEYSWTLGELAPEESKTITVTGTPAGREDLSTCYSVSYEPTVCQTIAVLFPKLQVETALTAQERKTEDAFYACDQLTLQYRIRNSGKAPLADFVVEDRLPDGVRTDDGENQVSIRIANLEPGESVERDVQLDVEQAASLNPSESVTVEGAEVEAGEQRLQIAQPQLAVEIDGPSSQRFGEPLVYRVTVRNESDVPALDAAVEIQKPELAKTFEVAEGEVEQDDQTFRLGRLNAQQEKTFQLRIEPQEAASFELRANANAYCVAEAATDEISTEVRGAPAVHFAVVDKQDPVAVGERTQYELTVQNEGSQTDRNLEIQARLPQEFSFVEATGDTEVRADGRVLEIGPIDTIRPGQSLSWTVTVEGLEAGSVRLSVRMKTDHIGDYVFAQEPTTITE